MSKDIEKQKKPVTMRIEELRIDLNQAVAKSELPAFLLEILIGEYLSGINVVAKKEYEQERQWWLNACKEEEKEGD